MTSPGPRARRFVTIMDRTRTADLLFSSGGYSRPRETARESASVGNHELNIVLLYIGDDPYIWLNYVDGRVFDERGYVLLYKSTNQPGFEPISVPNTPDIIATKNRLFAFNRAGEWQDFAIPEGFAKDFEKDVDSPCLNPPKKVLVELERYSKQRGLDDLSQWLKGQM